MNIEERVKKSILKFSTIELKVVSLVFVFLSVLIIIAGYFHAAEKVPRRRAYLPPVSEKAFQPAEDFFKEPANFSFVGFTELNASMMAVLDSQQDPMVDLYNRLNGRNIVLRLPHVAPVEAASQELGSKRGKLQSVIDNLNNRIANASWGEAYDLEQQRDEKKRELERIDGVVRFYSNLRFFPRTYLPYEDELSAFNYVAGTFQGFQHRSGSTWSVWLQDVRPVLDDSFLKEIGAAATEIDGNALESDRKKFFAMRDQANTEYETRLAEMQQAIDRMVDPARARIRDAFNERWFATLFLVLFSYFAGRILLWYFSLIRRKGLPHKTTHEIYFATNISSLLARLVALIITGLGLLALALNLFFAIESGRIMINPLGMQGPLTAIIKVLPISELIPGSAMRFGLLYGFLGPLAITLGTMFASWLWVLLSEFLCFISNVYHVLFHKAYKNDANISLE